MPNGVLTEPPFYESDALAREKIRANAPILEDTATPGNFSS